MTPDSWVWMARLPPSLTQSMPWRWLVCCWRCWQPGTAWTERCPASDLGKRCLRDCKISRVFVYSSIVYSLGTPLTGLLLALALLAALLWALLAALLPLLPGLEPPPAVTYESICTCITKY